MRIPELNYSITPWNIKGFLRKFVLNSKTMITVADRKQIARLVLTTHDSKVIEKIKLLILRNKFIV